MAMTRQSTTARAWMAALAAVAVVLLCAAPAAAEGGDAITQPDRWRNALWAVGLFAVLVVILRWLAWRPIMKVLQDREDSIAETIADAERRQGESEELLGQYQRRLDAVETEAAALLAKAKAEAEATRDQLLRHARRSATEAMEKVREEIEQAKRAALAEIYQTTAELASEVAGKIIAREVDPADHRRLVIRSLEKLGEN